MCNENNGIETFPCVGVEFVYYNNKRIHFEFIYARQFPTINSSYESVDKLFKLEHRIVALVI